MDLNPSKYVVRIARTRQSILANNRLHKGLSGRDINDWKSLRVQASTW